MNKKLKPTSPTINVFCGSCGTCGQNAAEIMLPDQRLVCKPCAQREGFSVRFEISNARLRKIKAGIGRRRMKMLEVYYSINANGLHMWVESRDNARVIAEACDAAADAVKPHAESRQNDTKAFVLVSRNFNGLGGPAATEYRRDLIKKARDAAKKKIRALGFKPVLDKF